MAANAFAIHGTYEITHSIFSFSLPMYTGLGCAIIRGFFDDETNIISTYMYLKP